MTFDLKGNFMFTQPAEPDGTSLIWEHKNYRDKAQTVIFWFAVIWEKRFFSGGEIRASGYDNWGQ